MTKRNIEILLKTFLLREKKIDWKTYADHFNINPSELCNESVKLTTKVTKIAEEFYRAEKFPVWWELRDILYRCCTYRPDDIKYIMLDIHENNVNGKT